MITAAHPPALAKLRTALAFHGLRAHEVFDELTYASPDCEVRLALGEQKKGQLVRCFVCVDESRLLTSGLEIFNELSLEGFPVVDFGTGGAKSTFEFQWHHPDGADWRISGQRVEGLRQRLVGILGERPSPIRPASRTRRSLIYSELVPAVFGRPATAA
ncbi:MAG: hypothetical protein JWM32_668 [Verrucomicrobia bacterium]|nr:hypothetical protein [Verrucomicrobiota bacterium]